MIFAMTADDEMSLVAIDAAKLGGDATIERMLALPMKLAPSKTEAYRLTSIASGVCGDVRRPIPAKRKRSMKETMTLTSLLPLLKMMASSTRPLRGKRRPMRA